MTDSVPEGASTWRNRTLWPRGRCAPLRSFLQTGSGSARVLAAAVVVALVWANTETASYEDAEGAS
jgi:hypothetical protein